MDDGVLEQQVDVGEPEKLPEDVRDQPDRVEGLH